MEIGVRDFSEEPVLAMTVENPLSQISNVLGKSVGIWLSVWAIRFGTGVDYKLSGQAKVVRWSAVFGCFALTSVRGSGLGNARLAAYAIGLSFLCWPNLAYHLSRHFERWPTLEAKVGSVREDSSSRLLVTYDFDLDGQRYGGQGTVKTEAGSQVREGTKIPVRYDPRNPGRSSQILLTSRRGP